MRRADAIEAVSFGAESMESAWKESYCKENTQETARRYK